MMCNIHEHLNYISLTELITDTKSEQQQLNNLIFNHD